MAILLKDISSLLTKEKYITAEEVEKVDGDVVHKQLKVSELNKIKNDGNYAVVKLQPIFFDYDIPGLHIVVTRIFNINKGERNE